MLQRSVGARDGYEHAHHQDSDDRRDLGTTDPLGSVDLEEAEAGKYDCRHDAQERADERHEVAEEWHRGGHHRRADDHHGADGHPRRRAPSRKGEPLLDRRRYRRDQQRVLGQRVDQCRHDGDLGIELSRRQVQRDLRLHVVAVDHVAQDRCQPVVDAAQHRRDEQHLGEAPVVLHGGVDRGEHGVAGEADEVEAQRCRQAAEVEDAGAVPAEPAGLGHAGPDQRRRQDRRRDEPDRRDVGEHAKVLEPCGGQHDGGGQSDEQLLPLQPVAAAHAHEVDAGAREELVEVVALEDEEADGHEVELHVHEEGDGPPAGGAEGELADVRVAGDGARVGAHAALDECAGVVADGADEGEEQQAEPPALRHRVRHGQHPDPRDGVGEVEARPGEGRAAGGAVRGELRLEVVAGGGQVSGFPHEERLAERAHRQHCCFASVLAFHF